MKLLLLLVLAFFTLNASLTAQQDDCFVSVETSGSYDKLTVETISLTMLRQFVDATIQPTPLGGFSEKACMYRINVTEQQEGIKVFMLGKKISDYGTSNLRGEPGLEQAILRAIYKGLDKQTNSICQKYGTMLEKECAAGDRSAPYGGETGWQPPPPPQDQPYGGQPPVRPECQPKQGQKVPDYCNQPPPQRQQIRRPPPHPPGPPRPECRPQRGKRLPDYCRRPRGPAPPPWHPPAS